MSKVIVEVDLCSTCVNDAACVYPRDSGLPVMQCAEFEGYVLNPPKTNGRANSPSNNPGVDPPTEESHSGKYMGLCRNCEDREACIYSKPEGGVWRCEEYR